MERKADSSLIQLKDIVGVLTKNHTSLKENLEQIRDGLQDFNAVKPLLLEFQGRLFDHFSYQSKDFYRNLKDLGLCDSDDKKHLQMLEDDLLKCKVRALEFYDRHPCTMADQSAKGMIDDFSFFYKMISDRLLFEDKVLNKQIKIHNP